ncbi:unnamed protein product [Allacma fusca]|uniref:Signal transducer and transcription activator n=1 Tax=Allacma fusca TaxID=39272 RepID=A0A8J2P1L4_9HEXA|nr:unnamed protein product [Allacma fusca]
MALWNQVQQLRGPALRTAQSLYGDQFPIEIRQYLAEWIEKKFHGPGVFALDPKDPSHEEYIQQLIEEFIAAVDTKAKTLPKEPQQKLLQASRFFKQRNKEEPLSIFKFLRNCLSMEKCLVDQMSGCVVGIIPDSKVREVAEIVERLTSLTAKTEETGKIMKWMEQEIQTINLHYHEIQNINGYASKLDEQSPTEQTERFKNEIILRKGLREQDTQHRINRVINTKTDFENKISIIISQLTDLQAKVLNVQLDNWKRQQQLAANTSKFNDSLDTLQLWCEDLAGLLWNIRFQLKSAERVKQGILQVTLVSTDGLAGDKLSDLQQKILQLLSALVSQSFIVEVQPPQVLKTNTKFPATVRLLVGGRLNVQMSLPDVSVSIISEEVANGLVQHDPASANLYNGKLLNSVITMDYNQSSSKFFAEFRNLKLTNIVRKGKKGGEFVTEEKFCLKFKTEFTLAEGELNFKIWTLSLPVVVIVHGSQDENAWATIFWDNAFSDSRRLPFAVPESVPWSYLADAINVRFTADTGRSLTASNLQFLAQKFCSIYPQNKPDTNFMVKWAHFFKDLMPNRGFTMWEWFYSIMKLTKEQLRNPWRYGLIEGFVSRNRTEDMLRTCPDGTFLLRFGESEKSGIAIAWVGSDKRVSFLLLTSKELGTRSLPDRILDIGQLKYVYPDIDKKSAFGKFSSDPKDPAGSKSKEGYVNFFEKMIIKKGEEDDPSSCVNQQPAAFGQSGSNFQWPNTFSQTSLISPSSAFSPAHTNSSWISSVSPCNTSSNFDAMAPLTPSNQEYPYSSEFHDLLEVIGIGNTVETEMDFTYNEAPLMELSGGGQFGNNTNM